jgi:hypothetical protein
MRSESPRDVWDKLQVLASVVASVFIPLAVAWIGYVYNIAVKNSENSVKYVELAVSILRADTEGDHGALRSWAVDLLNHQAAVKLSVEAQDQLRRTKLIIFNTGYVGTSYDSGYASTPASAPKK